ncbi:outer membrane beta-barrel protein [uncultured Arcticibacterium sp.]|uniref:outer membrane beta-barrel protein n=1 Tax=uncultured Arcticibacterium sp. TaxID=2173042 RepID=UPI0030F74D74
MKRVAVVLILLLISSVGYSQSALGIKGGVNLTNISTDAGSFNDNVKESLDTKTGFVFGLWGRLGQKLYLQPEVLIATKGGEVEVSPGGGAPVQVYDVKYTNLDIPVLVGFKPAKWLRVMGGPVASLKLSENDKLKEALNQFASGDEALEQATWGYQVGLGVKLLGVELDLRKEGSLTDINALNFKDADKFSQRASGWQLTLGFTIL